MALFKLLTLLIFSLCFLFGKGPLVNAREAESVVKTIEYFEDSSGKLEINDVLLESFLLSSTDIPNLGLSSSVYWFRVSLKTKNTSETPYILSVEKPLIDILVKIEKVGIKIDIKKLKDLRLVFQKKLSKIEKEIFKLSGIEFNIASPKQLGEVLFDKMSIDGGRKGKSGSYSTNVDVLENLSYQGHDIATYLLEWSKI